MADLIACQQVGYRQNGVDILAGIDWRIEPGRHWAVLGPNGSGKTTLLRIVCGYLWPTSGRVLRLGQELLDLSELRRSIGWISSGMNEGIPPGDTGLETVVTGRFAQIGLKHLPSFGPTETDFDDAAAELELLGCGALADKPFGILSQGERQQVLIARARMAKPLLMVLDEPCAGMDPGVRERFLAWLNERLSSDFRSSPLPLGEGRGEGATPVGITSLSDMGHSSFDLRHSAPTTILVTHHIEEILPAIAHTLVLSGGRVHSAGPTHDVVSQAMMETVYGTKLARIQRSGGRLWPIWD